MIKENINDLYLSSDVLINSTVLNLDDIHKVSKNFENLVDIQCTLLEDLGADIEYDYSFDVRVACPLGKTNSLIITGFKENPLASELRGGEYEYENLIIPETLSGCPVIGIEGPENITDENLKAMNSVKYVKIRSKYFCYINKNAFSNCENLRYVKITGPKHIKISSGAFQNCSSLKEIKINEDTLLSTYYNPREYIVSEFGPLYLSSEIITDLKMLDTINDVYEDQNNGKESIDNQEIIFSSIGGNVSYKA